MANGLVTTMLPFDPGARFATGQTTASAVAIANSTGRLCFRSRISDSQMQVKENRKNNADPVHMCRETTCESCESGK